MDERSSLLKEIQAEDFALYETALFLDTHPKNQCALAYYRQHRDAVLALREQYEALYGPLTLYGVQCESAWSWVETPWPWEKEAN